MRATPNRAARFLFRKKTTQKSWRVIRKHSIKYDCQFD